MRAMIEVYIHTCNMRAMLEVYIHTCTHTCMRARLWWQVTSGPDDDNQILEVEATEAGHPFYCVIPTPGTNTLRIINQATVEFPLDAYTAHIHAKHACIHAHTYIHACTHTTTWPPSSFLGRVLLHVITYPSRPLRSPSPQARAPVRDRAYQRSRHRGVGAVTGDRTLFMALPQRCAPPPNR